MITLCIRFPYQLFVKQEAVTCMYPYVSSPIVLRQECFWTKLTSKTLVWKVNSSQVSPKSSSPYESLGAKIASKCSLFCVNPLMHRSFPRHFEGLGTVMAFIRPLFRVTQLVFHQIFLQCKRFVTHITLERFLVLMRSVKVSMQVTLIHELLATFVAFMQSLP
jgi:hypothetical protein